MTATLADLRAAKAERVAWRGRRSTVNDRRDADVFECLDGYVERTGHMPMLKTLCSLLHLHRTQAKRSIARLVAAGRLVRTPWGKTWLCLEAVHDDA